MLRKFLPDVMDQDELRTIDSLLESLNHLKKEALGEDQAFIAYAIEDAILAVKKERNDKHLLQNYQNIS